MVNAQEVRYSDEEIEEFIQERKVLPDNWYSKLIRPNKEKGELTVIGDNGNEFRNYCQTRRRYAFRLFSHFGSYSSQVKPRF